MYIAIEISFDRSENQTSEPPFVQALRYGSRLPLTGESADPNQIKPLKPGEIVDIILTDVTYDVVKKALNKLKYPSSIERVEVYIAEVIFDDNTSWSAGRMFRRDPRNPDEWIPDEPERGSAASGTANFLAYANSRLEQKSAFHKTFWGEVQPSKGQDSEQSGTAFVNLLSSFFRSAFWTYTEPVQQQCGEPAPISRRTCTGASSSDCRN